MAGFDAEFVQRQRLAVAESAAEHARKFGKAIPSVVQRENTASGESAAKPDVRMRVQVASKGATLIPPEVYAALLVVRVPMKLGRGQNEREHWTAKAARVKREHEAMAVALAGPLPHDLAELRRAADEMGLTVRITRIAPKHLDDDNATASAKAVRDSIAAWLGIDDGDARVRYEVRQRCEGARTYGVQVEFLPGAA